MTATDVPVTAPSPSWIAVVVLGVISIVTGSIALVHPGVTLVVTAVTVGTGV